MKIAIIGTGSLATLLAGRLSAVCNVQIVGRWVAQIDAVNRNGIRIIEGDGQITAAPHVTAIHADAVTKQDADIALVLTKTHQMADTIGRIHTILKEDGMIVTLQNGIGNVEQLATPFGANRCGLGVVSYGANMGDVGVVHAAGNGEIFLVAPPIDNANILAGLFAQAHLTCTVGDDANSAVWSKLAINASINPLTALLEKRNGYLVQNEKARQMMVSAGQEVTNLANLLSIKLRYKNVQQILIEVAEKTAENRSSMLQDIQRNSPTEIDAICGQLIQIGEKHGMSMPVNRLLYRLIKEKEQGILHTENSLYNQWKVVESSPHNLNNEHWSPNTVNL